jgi:hypothetical protein
MSPRARIAGVSLAFLLAWSASSRGDTPKIVAHLVPAESSVPCSSTPPTLPPCSSIAIQGDVGVPYRIYLIASGVDFEVKDMEFGIAYEPASLQGVDVLGWCDYANLEISYPGPFGRWPAPESGLTFRWYFCRSADENSNIVIGALDVIAYSDDVFYVTASARDSVRYIWGCQPGKDYRLDEHELGRIGFGDRPGFNPCNGEGTWTPVPSYPPPVQLTLSPAAVLLHIGSASGSPSPCEEGPGSAHEVVTSEPITSESTPRIVYLLAVPQGADDPEPAYGVTGVQAGVDYTPYSGQGQGLEMIDWNRCSDLDFPGDDWPSAGSGNTITWSIDNCQKRDLVVAGYFSVVVHGQSTMSVAPFPPTGLVKVATCKGSEVVADQDLPPARLGWLSFAGGTKGTDSGGCNPLLEPCDETPTQVTPATWGKIKALYR